MPPAATFGVVYDHEPVAISLSLVAPPEPPPLRLYHRSNSIRCMAPAHLRVSGVEDLDIPLMHAILAARQALLARQERDGLWREARPSIRITALRAIAATVAGADAQLARSACRWLMQQQRSEGAWCAMNSDALDLDDSVLAYLALRLTGHEPWEESLQSARAAIRRAGGADSTSGNTRCWLALAGQIPWPAKPWLGLKVSETTAAGSRGHVVGHPGLIRELFLDHAEQWAAPAWQRWSPAELQVWDAMHHRGSLVELDRTSRRAAEDARAWCEQPCSVVTTAGVWTALWTSGIQPPGDSLLGAQTATNRTDTDLSRQIALLRRREARNTEPASRTNLPPELRIEAYPAPPVSTADDLSSQAIELSPVHLEELRRVAVERLKELAAHETPWTSTHELADSIELAGRCGVSDEHPLLRAAIAALVGRQCADGRWRDAVAADHEMTCRVLRALAAAGVSGGNEFVDAGVYWLAASQNPSGGWSNEAECGTAANISARPTAEAVLALIAAGAGDCRAADRGVQYLIAMQTIDGEWDDELVETTALALLALSRWSTTTRRSNKAEATSSLRLVESSLTSDC